MAFTINDTNTLITQSGTDTDLEGLIAIADVTTTNLNGHRQIVDLRTVNVGGTQVQLNVEGDFLIDPEFYSLILGVRSLSLNTLAGGTLRVGVEKTVNGQTRYSEGVALTSLQIGGQGQYDPNGIVFNSGSFFFWNGGTIETMSPMGGLIDHTNIQATINAGIFRGLNVSNTISRANLYFFRNDGLSSDLTVNGVILDHKDPTKGGAGIFSSNGIDVGVFDIRAGFIQERAGSSTGALRLRNLIISKNAFSYSYRFNGSVAQGSQGSIITNVDVGTKWDVYTSYNTNVLGHLAIFHELNISIKDTSGNNVEGAISYIKTINRGNRINVRTQEPELTSLQGGILYDNDLHDVYNAESDINGDFPLQTILTGRHFKEDGADFHFVDLYGKTDVTGDDLFDLNLFSYNHNLDVSEIVLKGAQPLNIQKVLVTDTSITQLVKSVTDVYTLINSTARFYDRAKAHLIDNYDGETTTLVSRSGNELIVPDGYNVTLDGSDAGTFAEAFVVTDTDITIRTGGAYSGSIILGDGVVTLINGATISGGFSDNNQDSLVEIVGIDLTGGNTLEVSANDGVNWTVLANNTYSYLANANASVLFRYTEVNEGEPKIQTDDYVLNAGLNNSFVGFASDTGILISSQTNVLSDLITENKNVLDEISAKVDNNTSKLDVIDATTENVESNTQTS